MPRAVTVIAVGLMLAVITAAWPLMQRIPNGADHYYMIDVGETQIVLNNWGTLHATGYPHYVILGNLITAPLRMIGVSPALAAAGVSLLFGLMSAALLYALAYHLTERVALSAGMVLAYTLTRSVWIHHVIAEIYTFGLALLALLLMLALHRGVFAARPTWRVYALAIVGGIGVAHHRAIGMAAPALLFAVWPILAAHRQRIGRVLGLTLALGVAGFIPYAYLMLRARAGAAWVYGEPQTWAGLWAQIRGTEASRFIGPPDSLPALWANLAQVNGVIALDVGVIGVVLGVAGLAIALTDARHRRPALVLIGSAAVAYSFHVVAYTDILTALILPVTLSLAFGWLLGADVLLLRLDGRTHHAATLGVWALLAVSMAWSITTHGPFIREQVTDPRGLDVIALAATAPPDSTLMLPWGPQHFAVGYARDISGALPNVAALLDHKANYLPAFEAGTLVVPEYVRHAYPPDWWAAQLDAPVYASAVAPSLVALRPSPERADSIPLYVDIVATQERITCDENTVTLWLTWLGPAVRQESLSVFVHALDANGTLVAQDDRFAPVYGWRPLPTWNMGEVIYDVYQLPRVDGITTLSYGLYRQTEAGEFINEVEYERTLDCE